MCGFGAVLVILAVAIQFNDKFQLLLVLNGILNFPSIKAFTNTPRMIVNFKDISMYLIDVSKQRLNLSLDNPKLVRMILPRTIERLVEIVLLRVQTLE